MIPANTHKYFHSGSGIGQWMRFDFTISKIKLNAFEITTTTNRDPLNWRFEGSNNGVSFEIIY